MSARAVYLLSGGPSSGPGQVADDCRVALAACKKPQPNVAYIGTPNNDNELFFQASKRMLRKAGAGNVQLAQIAGGYPYTDAAKRMLAAADVVFLSGGEVEDGMLGLAAGGITAFLAGLYHDGKLFIGMSAGCIMMGRHWVHWDVEGDDSTAYLFPCLGFVPMLFDAHGEKEDWKELKCALRLLGPGARGIGLTNGGFFSADGAGHLKSYRNAPLVLRNNNGIIEQEEEGWEQ